MQLEPDLEGQSENSNLMYSHRSVVPQRTIAINNTNAFSVESLLKVTLTTLISILGFLCKEMVDVLKSFLRCSIASVERRKHFFSFDHFSLCKLCFLFDMEIIFVFLLLSRSNAASVCLLLHNRRVLSLGYIRWTCVRWLSFSLA